MSKTLTEWLASPLGQYVLAQEMAGCDETVADIFGFNAMQVGLPQHDFLRASRIPLRFSVATEGEARVRARAWELPLATQSLDLVVLPHVLEFAQQPHQVLREIDRVMMPEGRVVVIGFNPWSLWGLRQALGASREAPWQGNFISLLRLKDWFALLGFDVSAGRLACYVPPLTNERWLARFGFMETAGNRWWGVAGGIYIVQAIKRVQGMRLIMPKWKDARVAEKAVAPFARKAQGETTAENLPANVITLRRKK